MKPMNDEIYESIWGEFDRQFIEKIKTVQAETKRFNQLRDESFDRMEAEADYFQKMKICHKINNSKSPNEISRLWQDFKIIEKRTRL